MGGKFVFKQGQVFNPNRFTPDLKPEKQEKKKPTKIKPRSDKRAKEETVYLRLRKVFLEGKTCQCEGCNNKATTVHHKMGRLGKLLCDIRFWLAACMDCHTKIENHPEWAYEMGYSLLRNTKDNG
jgi:hypothetical protein